MTPEVCEVVVISGPRKGEIATIAAEVLSGNGQSGHHADDERELTPEEEAALDVVLQAAHQAAERATSLSMSMKELVSELREVNRKLHEPA